MPHPPFCLLPLFCHIISESWTALKVKVVREKRGKKNTKTELSLCSLDYRSPFAEFPWVLRPMLSSWGCATLGLLSCEPMSSLGTRLGGETPRNFSPYSLAYSKALFLGSPSLLCLLYSFGIWPIWECVSFLSL